MVKEIRIYVEGGGDDNKTWIIVREGFSVFLKDLKEIADINKIYLRIIPCGLVEQLKIILLQLWSQILMLLMFYL